MSAPETSTVAVGNTTDGTTIVLAGMVGVSDAASFRACALRAVEQPGEVTVDCSGVDDLDAAALQVLLALQQALVVRRRALRMAAVPHAVVVAMRVGGFDSLLAACTAAAAPSASATAERGA